MTLPSTFLNKCFKCHFYSSRRTSVPSYLKSMHKCTSYGPDKSRCKNACITHIHQTEVVATMFRSLQAGATKTSICVLYFPYGKKITSGTNLSLTLQYFFFFIFSLLTDSCPEVFGMYMRYLSQLLSHMTFSVKPLFRPYYDLKNSVHLLQ